MMEFVRRMREIEGGKRGKDEREERKVPVGC